MAELVKDERESGHVSKATGYLFPEPLRNLFQTIMIGNTPSYQSGSMWCMADARVVDVDPQAVQAALDKKEANLADYRKIASEIWLLVHGSYMLVIGAPKVGRWSTHGQVTRELEEATFVSSFDRVYYYDGGEQRAVRLRVAAKAPVPGNGT